ncbi:MAG: class I SAM-dependent DNA methyltransferase [Chloroflexota bacterium]
MDVAGTCAYYATIAPLYDTELAERDDLPCWSALVAAWKPYRSAEYGCGTGRVAVPLALQCAQWGGDMAGLDLSPAMLRLARQHWRSNRGSAPRNALHLTQGDMRRAALDHAVDLVLFANDPLTHLGRDADLAATFRQVGRHLRSGGRLVVEASLLPPEARGEDHPITLRSCHTVGAATGRLTIETERCIDPVRKCASVIYWYRAPAAPGGQPTATEAQFVAHYLDLSSLEALFHLAGCRLEERWSDPQFRALTNYSAMAICTGRKE